jgi:four helix bundle protein
MTQLTFERLDVFNAAVDFAVHADGIAGSFGRGRAYLADQLRRAASSIVLNIAEGAGEFAEQDKARFYRMALRSAHECGGTIILGQRLGITEGTAADHARRQLSCSDRVIAMLTKLAKRCSAAGAGAGAGVGAGGA